MHCLTKQEMSQQKRSNIIGCKYEDETIIRTSVTTICTLQQLQIITTNETIIRTSVTTICTLQQLQIITTNETIIRTTVTTICTSQQLQINKLYNLP